MGNFIQGRQDDLGDTRLTEDIKALYKDGKASDCNETEMKTITQTSKKLEEAGISSFFGTDIEEDKSYFVKSNIKYKVITVDNPNYPIESIAVGYGYRLTVISEEKDAEADAKLSFFSAKAELHQSSAETEFLTYGLVDPDMAKLAGLAGSAFADGFNFESHRKFQNAIEKLDALIAAGEKKEPVELSIVGYTLKD
ncbi:hypothetical protein NDJ13_17825 [Vibrio alginolyticus]|uniref:hypothetical protein n=1 Tax=Vibrio alginolyticus TaxID=663 RepID=UPI00215E1E2B|nr:hypothetical protein [Vibrio alginolyticus]MCS0140275.1 hypothetical protein [Vibrio alginolyticus]